MATRNARLRHFVLLPKGSRSGDAAAEYVLLILEGVEAVDESMPRKQWHGLLFQ
jgi:hypothetical protein